MPTADRQMAEARIARRVRAFGLRGAVIANVALLGLLAAVLLVPRAGAQGSGRARGEYTMVAGRIMGGNSSVVYVIDAANQEIVALRWNDSTKTLEGIGYRDVNADALADPGR